MNFKNVIENVINLSTILLLEVLLVANPIVLQFLVFFAFLYQSRYLGAKCCRPHGGHGTIQPPARDLANPSRRTDPCRPGNVLSSPTSRPGKVGTMTTPKHQTCQLHAADSQAPPIVRMEGRDNAASAI